MIRHALTKGLKVRAWTFDELYGRDSKFLDGLDDLGEGYVAEIPADTELWTSKPNLTRRQPVKREKRGRKRNTPRIIRGRPACEVRNLIRYSSKFQKQDWQRYRIKDTDKGPEVWEVKWLRVWRKTQDKLPSRQQTLIVARNVRQVDDNYDGHVSREVDTSGSTQSRAPCGFQITHELCGLLI